MCLVTTTFTGLSRFPLRRWRTSRGNGEGFCAGESSVIGVFTRCRSAKSWSLQPGVDALRTSSALGPWSGGSCASIFSHGLEPRTIVVFVAAGVEVANPETSSSVSLNVSCLTYGNNAALLPGLLKRRRRAFSPSFSWEGGVARLVSGVSIWKLWIETFEMWLRLLKNWDQKQYFKWTVCVSMDENNFTTTWILLTLKSAFKKRQFFHNWGYMKLTVK